MNKKDLLNINIRKSGGGAGAKSFSAYDFSSHKTDKTELDSAIDTARKLKERSTAKQNMSAKDRINQLFEKADMAKKEAEIQRQQSEKEPPKEAPKEPVKEMPLNDDQLKQQIEQAKKANMSDKVKNLSTDSSTSDILNAVLNDIF